MTAFDSVRLRLDLAYDGTDFHGWAKQSGELRTVQGIIEDKLSLISQQQVALTVAGRTDAGVHAVGQVAHVDIPAAVLEHRSVAGQPARLVGRLAKLLPEDIRVDQIAFAPPGFDARFSALRRHYRYRLTTNAAGALPTRARDTAVFLKPVDVDLMQETANHLVGLHDFAAFCKYKPHATTVRNVQSFQWHDVSTPEEPELLEARIAADAFCWSMVRSLVGCCVAVGQKTRDVTFPLQLLQADKRSSTCPVAPAKGLTLTQVDYPPAAQLAARAEQTRQLRSLD